MKTIVSQKFATGFLSSIEKDTIKNSYFRKVLFTTPLTQLVLMSLKPGEEIGSETHQGDQFFRFEAGKGKIVLNGSSTEVKDGDSITIPSGTEHNIINISTTEDLKLYSIYSPPQHKKGTVHKTKAEAKEEHFDGETDV
jgi:mannose-6-phosphate isomerase-like protein (cupin superfamily)